MASPRDKLFRGVTEEGILHVLIVNFVDERQRRLVTYMRSRARRVYNLLLRYGLIVSEADCRRLLPWIYYECCMFGDLETYRYAASPITEAYAYVWTPALWLRALGCYHIEIRGEGDQAYAIASEEILSKLLLNLQVLLPRDEYERVVRLVSRGEERRRRRGERRGEEEEQ